MPLTDKDGGPLKAVLDDAQGPHPTRDVGCAIAITESSETPRQRHVFVDAAGLVVLAKAYRAVVREQSFTRGRDAVLRPAEHVHRLVDPGQTPTAGAPHLDGRLQLAWP